MSRKRKNKKGRPGADGQWNTTGLTGLDDSTTGLADSEAADGDGIKASDFAPGGDASDSWIEKGKNNLPGQPGEGIRLGEAQASARELVQRDEPVSKQPEQISPVSIKSPEPESRPITGPLRESSFSERTSSGGVVGKIARWWRGPSTVTVRVPSNPPGAYIPEKLPTPPASKKPVPPAPLISANVSEPPLSGPTSAVEKVHAVLMLERVLPELEETKRLLQQERDSNQAKIRDLERDRDRLRQEADRARNDQGDIAGHTNVLRKSVSALERQLQEERATAAKNTEEYEQRIRAFEDSIKNSRNPMAQMRAELEESQTQKDRMESLVDRYKGELETSQRQLKEEQEAAQSRIRQLESELSRKSGATDTVRVERDRIEERAALVQKALDVMEHQLREEREDSAKQIRQLELELAEARSKTTQLETRVSSLTGDLDKFKSRPRKKGAAVEAESEDATLLTTRSAGRIQSLEKELSTSTSPIFGDRQTATTRISRLESRWEDLKSRLLPKDREITELRQLTEALRSRMEELEMELADAREQAEEAREQAAVPAPVAESSGASAIDSAAGNGGGGLLPLSREAVESLYNQSMSKLTVLMASADIAMMNPKIDAKLRGSIEDIKTEGQSLLELIKSYALHPDVQKSH